MKAQVASIIALALLVPALALPQGYGNNQQNQYNQQRGSRFNQQQQSNYDDYEAQGSARQSSQQRNNQQYNKNQQYNSNNNQQYNSNNNQQYNSNSNQQYNDNNQQYNSNSNQQYNSNSNQQYNSNSNQQYNSNSNNINTNDGFTRKSQGDSGNYRSDQTTFIPIIRFDKEQTLDGSYKTSWETGNNIVAEETGVLKNFGGDNQDAVVQQGSFSYTSPEGTLITVQYTADEQGFRATGDHLPTPPPIPAEIQKGLDIIYAGIKEQEQQQQRNPQQYQSNNDGQYQQSNFQNDGSNSDDYSGGQGSNINFRNSGERVNPGRRNEFRAYGQ